MAQPPFRSDQYQIEGDGPGDRFIRCDAVDGALTFTDPAVPVGVKLAELAGLQRAQNTIVVTPSGIAASKDAEGAPITGLQQALDAIPASSGPNSPWTILIGPGIYRGDLMVTKDHVTLLGLGGVTLIPLTAQSTIRVLRGPSSTPRRVRFQNLRITNPVAARACIDLSTARYALGSITVAFNPNVGDSATIAGQVLTAVANGSVPAPGEFELGTTLAETAANLVVAIQDPVNALGAVVVSSLGPVVSLRATEPGVLGNLITLASSVPLVLVISAPTLLGGADASTTSEVGSERIEVVDCDLVATGVGGFQLRALAVNNIRIVGGSWEESGTGTYLDVRNCASLHVQGVVLPKRIELHYNAAAPQLPLLPPAENVLVGLDTSFSVNSDLDGGGSLRALECQLGDVAMAGTQNFFYRNCQLGNVFAGDTIFVTLSNSTRGVLTGDATATFSESRLVDSVTFVAASSVSYAFPVPRVDGSYTVLLDNPVTPVSITSIPYVTNKTATGFDVVYGVNQNAVVPLTVLSQV